MFPATFHLFHRTSIIIYSEHVLPIYTRYSIIIFIAY